MADILSKILNGLGSFLSYALDHTQNNMDRLNNEIDKTRQKAEGYSDDRLKKAYQNTSSMVEKKAYYDVLTERKNKNDK